VPKKFTIFQKLLSWFVPHQITHFATQNSDEVYLYLYKGELMLCTQKATYSHGLEYSPFSIPFKYLSSKKKLHPKKFLLLGGGLAAANYLLFKKYKLLPQSTIVDLEPAYKKAAAGFLPSELWRTLDYQIADAFKFIETNSLHYDMIGIDLFQHLEMVAGTLEFSFLQNCAKIMSPQGILIMNTFFIDIKEAESFESTFRLVFKEYKLLIHDKNYIFLGFR
jgi:predicted membrane-bound spermidine synthase